MRQLDNLNVKELKQMIKSKGFSGYSKLNKNELINFISNNISKKKKSKSRRSRKVSRSRHKKRRNIDMGGFCTKPSCTDDDNSYYIIKEDKNEEGKLRKQFEREFKAKRDAERRKEKEEKKREERAEKLIRKKEIKNQEKLEKLINKKEKLDEIANYILDTFNNSYMAYKSSYNNYVDRAKEFNKMETLDTKNMEEYERYVFNTMSADTNIEDRFLDDVHELKDNYRRIFKDKLVNKKEKLDEIANYILDTFKQYYESDLRSYRKYANNAENFNRMETLDTKNIEEYERYVFDTISADINIEDLFFERVEDLKDEYRKIFKAKKNNYY